MVAEAGLVGVVFWVFAGVVVLVGCEGGGGGGGGGRKEEQSAARHLTL